MHGLPYHWYRLTPLHLVLYPFSLLFRMVAALRRLGYRWRLLTAIRMPVPVIVVGNISVGGTGKTPLTLTLVQEMAALGWHPGIISRGYGGKGGKLPREVHVDDPVEAVGDEPLLMAQRKLCPVWIGRDRPATALALLRAHPECDVIFSDDGLQHYRLLRDVEIAVIDGARRSGNGLLLPAGPLREPVSRLRTVDAIVVNGGTAHAGEFAMQLEGTRFHNLLNPEQIRTASDFAGQRVHAIAGIGHPGRFFAHLQKLGLQCTPHAFPDHHAYTPSELSFADSDALLMTEKDAVKCAPFASEKHWVLRVDAQVSPALVQLIVRKVTP